MNTKKKLSGLFGIATILIAGAGVSYANEEVPHDFYLAPFGNFIRPGGDSRAYNGFGAGLAVGKVINQHINIEARGFWQNYLNKLPCCGGAETDLIGATLDGQYFLFRDTFSPYLVSAIGGMETNVKGTFFESSATSFIFEAGAGSTYKLTDNVLLRADVRYRLNTLPTNVGSSGVLNDMVINFGFVINTNWLNQ